MTSDNSGLPLGWIKSHFADLTCRDRTGTISKVPKSSYKEVGRLPVVDQGQDQIAGYVDDYELQYRGRLPVIVFGDHTRKFKYVDFPFVAGADGTRLIAPSIDRVDVRFFYYALCNMTLKNLGYSRHFKLLKEQVVRFPENLAEQRKIAAILLSVDDTIEKTQAVIDQAQIVKRGLMQVMLTRGLPGRHTRFTQMEAGEIPDGWDRKTIAEIGEVVTGSTPSTSNHTFWNGEIPFVTPTDLGRAKRVSTTGRHVSEDGLAQVREIPPGSVMVTCIGTIGKVGIAVEICCTNQQINSVITGDEILSEYLYYALSFAAGTLVGLAGMTAVPIVSKSKFLSCGVLVPPLAEQEQIVHVLSSVDHVIEVNQERVAKLTEAKRGLMPLLLDGELRVTPNTEAA